jgi:hypothetical protein
MPGRSPKPTIYSHRGSGDAGPDDVTRATTRSLGGNRTVDSMIVDLSLLSFVVLIISLMVIPERRSTAVVAEPAAA